VNDLISRWIVVKSKFGEVKNDALTGRGGKDVERGECNFGANTRDPTIKLRIGSNDLVVPEVKGASDIEKSVSPPYSGIPKLPDDATVTCLGEGEFFGMSCLAHGDDCADRNHIGCLL
jgi:hypothetical protein